MTSPIVRFAPSPTGRIHIGNARVALFNFCSPPPTLDDSRYGSMTLILLDPARNSRVDRD
jgi:hypothetical protein